MSGSINMIDSGVEIDSSVDNHVTADRFKLLISSDKNNQRYGAFQFAARASGRTDISMAVTNMDYDGNLFSGGIWVCAEKLGQIDYIVSNPDAFRYAIGVTKSEVYTNSKSCSITAANIDSNVEGADISVPRGIYLIRAQWVFNSTTTARVTKCMIWNYSDNREIAQQRIAQGTGNFCVVECTAIAAFSDTKIIQVRGASNVTSGAGSTNITAVRVGVA